MRVHDRGILRKIAEVFYKKYTSTIIPLLKPNPFSLTAFLIGFWSIDYHLRYSEASRLILGRKVLDVGAGGRSILALKFSNCISLDVNNLAGLDIVASATHLPFRDNAFDTVTCIDTLEHIPGKGRHMALEEIKRVARLRAIVHAPMDDGAKFSGRKYDILFQMWHKKTKGYEERNTSEHIKLKEPSPMELEAHGFKLKGTHNAELWLNYMRLQHLPIPQPIPQILGRIYYLLNKRKDKQPPFWGAICVYDKIRAKLLDSNLI